MRSHRHIVRSFASQAELPDEGSNAAVNFAKVLVILMLAGVGYRVLPTLGQNTVEHASALLESDEPFWQQSGIERAKWIAKTDVGIEKLLEKGISQRLVNVLDEGKDTDCHKAALQLIEVMNRSYDAREKFLLAGLMDVLKRKMSEHDANFELYKQLVIQYKIQQNHVE